MSPILFDPSSATMRALGFAGLVVFGLLVALASRSPIFRIDVITASRRFRYFLVRILYGIVLLFVLWISYESIFGGTLFWSYRQETVLNHRNSAQFASTFFQFFAWVQMLTVLIITPAVVAGTIASERERRTIEYLFATDLSNFELVGGKLLARLAQLIGLLVLALPLLQIARLFGGIRNDDLLVAFVIAVSTLVCVAGLSISMSVWSKRGRDAVISSYVILLAMLIGPPTLKGLVGAFFSSGNFLVIAFNTVNGLLVAANPFTYMIDHLTRSGQHDWDAIWLMASLHAGFAAVCLLFSIVAVRRVHLKASGAPARKKFQLRLPRPPVGPLPMHWKELFAEPLVSRMGILTRLALFLLIALVVVVMGYGFVDSYKTYNYSWGSNDWALRQYRSMASFMSTLVCLGLLLIVAAKAASSVTSEKEKDSWLSILSTNLSANEIISAKILGSVYQVRWLGLLLVFIWGLSLIRHPASFIITIPAQMITFLAVALAISALGVHLSMWCSTSVRAMAATLGICIFIGGPYLLCCMPAMIFGAADENVQLIFAPCIPFLMFYPLMYDPYDTLSSFEVPVFTAYLIGTIGYGLAAAVLYVSAAGNFEAMSERVRKRTTTSIPRPPQIPAKPAPVVPEVVETNDETGPAAAPAE